VRPRVKGHELETEIELIKFPQNFLSHSLARKFSRGQALLLPDDLIGRHVIDLDTIDIHETLE